MPRSAASGGPKKGRPGPKANKLAEEFPAGMKLQDLCKKQWHLGHVIGQGGFGLIYLASEDIAKTVDKKTAGYVIKIEPKGNGPLYCEMQFYQRAAKPGAIQTFISTHQLRYLGVPPYIATGRQEYNGHEYRFLVMPRYGKDLQKVFVELGKFQPHTVFSIALRMVDALRFLHENEYVHADVKASNILMGFAKGMDISNEVYLVDYGLAYRYIVDGVHKEYKEDPRKAHDGTIEFTSRDAHKGVSPSRRGDFEILGYCMLQWLTGHLPWEDGLGDPNYVAMSKEKFMNNIPSLIATSLADEPKYCSECLTQYMDLVKKLKYDSTPDYKRIQDILISGLNKAGQRDEWKIDLGAVKGKKRKSTDPEPSWDSPAAKKAKSPAKQAKSPARQAKSPAKQAKSPAKQAKSPAAAKASKSPAKGKAAKSPAKQAKAAAGVKRSSPKKVTPASKEAKLPVSKVKGIAVPKAAGVSPAVLAASKAKAVARKSLLAKGRSPKSPGAKAGTVRTPMTNTNGGASGGKKPLKQFPKPPSAAATVSPARITPLTPAGSRAYKQATKRKVKRVAVVQNDASNQTSPGLLKNR